MIALAQRPRTFARHFKATSPEVTLRAVEQMLAERVTAATPKFGCLMAMLPSLDAELPNWAADHIASEDLRADGVEVEPHATVLYGFALDFPVEELREVLRTIPPIELVIGEQGRFEAPAYDVLKFAVESPDLKRLNATLADRFRDRITFTKWVSGE